ncbi:cold-shock' DNA-binding domain-containing protein [Mucor lusitanicus]|uniref:Cold-shock' DNA-binding domain-containing protein n=1 Tax=Mucor circinelloides f. lusitanicus TaxID=29924 RepID=A0A8H4BQN1_MUCCL|nr:cold-shock' DNA-binding domain-containing protein [Mucor lusitanicus]
MEDKSRHKGRVKFFNSTKGFGFILPDAKEENDDIEEVFVHHTAIHNDGGFKSLAEGEEVEYDLVQGPKGMQASNVTGPQGVSVQGDPRAQRQYYPNHHGYRNNHNNRGGPGGGGPYNGGGMCVSIDDGLAGKIK